VNGQLVNTQIHPAGNAVVPLTYFSDMKIGRSGSNGHFNGKIDDVRLYNQALSIQEIQDMYNAFLTGLQARYMLDEGGGSVAADSSGNGNSGVINGATWTTGKSGGGLSFDGASDSVSIPCINSEEISVAAWFYKNAKDTTNIDSIFGGYKWNSDVQQQEGFDLRFYKTTPDRLEFVLVTQDGSGNRTQKAAVKDLVNSVGSWYHVVGTYNKATGEQKLYVNGQLVNTRNHPAGNTVVPLTLYSDMKIGQSMISNGYFNGKIDGVKIYNRVLTDQEVQDLYNAL
ncbi:MAG: LamG domain-containing protein, partial [Candidatus Brocadia sinica]|nr:LamG domain-containing protein [Candidatus Brocadia sinica]